MSNRSWSHQLHRKAMKERIKSNKFFAKPTIFLFLIIDDATEPRDTEKGL